MKERKNRMKGKNLFFDQIKGRRGKREQKEDLQEKPDEEMNQD